MPSSAAASLSITIERDLCFLLISWTPSAQDNSISGEHCVQPQKVLQLDVIGLSQLWTIINSFKFKDSLKNDRLWHLILHVFQSSFDCMHIKSLFSWLLIRVEVEFLTNSHVSLRRRAQGCSQNLEEIQKWRPADIGTFCNVSLLCSCFGKS